MSKRQKGNFMCIEKSNLTIRYMIWSPKSFEATLKA